METLWDKGEIKRDGALHSFHGKVFIPSAGKHPTLKMASAPDTCQADMRWIASAVERMKTDEQANKVIDRMFHASRCSDRMFHSYRAWWLSTRSVEIDQRTVGWGRKSFRDACLRTMSTVSRIGLAVQEACLDLGVCSVDWQ